MVVKDDGLWKAVVGLPLSSEPGKHQIEVYYGNGERRTVAFAVVEKEYETQRLTITNQRQVDPTEEDMIRIRSDRSRINNALASWSDASVESPAFDVPVDGVTINVCPREFLQLLEERLGAGLHLWIRLGQRMDEGKVQFPVVESASEAPIFPFGFTGGFRHLAGFLLGGEASLGFLRHCGRPRSRVRRESTRNLVIH